MKKNNPAKKPGLLKNGNPQGDPNSAPRCGAKTRKGTTCRAPAMRGKKRCRLHGGKSTGPRTPEGIERSKTARLRHGLYSEDFEQQKRELKSYGELLEIMAEPGLSHPVALESLANILLKRESHDAGGSFLENIDFHKLSFDDKQKIYEKSSAVLNRGARALAKFGEKVAKEK